MWSHEFHAAYIFTSFYNLFCRNEYYYLMSLKNWIFFIEISQGKSRLKMSQNGRITLKYHDLHLKNLGLNSFWISHI